MHTILHFLRSSFGVFEIVNNQRGSFILTLAALYAVIIERMSLEFNKVYMIIDLTDLYTLQFTNCCVVDLCDRPPTHSFAFLYYLQPALIEFS